MVFIFIHPNKITIIYCVFNLFIGFKGRTIKYSSKYGNLSQL